MSHQELWSLPASRRPWWLQSVVRAMWDFGGQRSNRVRVGEAWGEGGVRVGQAWCEDEVRGGVRDDGELERSVLA